MTERVRITADFNTMNADPERRVFLPTHVHPHLLEFLRPGLHIVIYEPFDFVAILTGAVTHPTAGVLLPPLLAWARDNALSTLSLVPVQPPLAQLQASTGYAKLDVELPHRPHVDCPGGAGPRYQRVKRLLIRAAHFELEIPHVRYRPDSLR